MPVYDYKCNCGIKEQRVSIADRDNVKCIECGEVKERVMNSAPPLLYSGSSRDVKAIDQTRNMG